MIQKSFEFKLTFYCVGKKHQENEESSKYKKANIIFRHPRNKKWKSIIILEIVFFLEKTEQLGIRSETKVTRTHFYGYYELLKIFFPSWNRQVSFITVTLKYDLQRISQENTLAFFNFNVMEIFFYGASKNLLLLLNILLKEFYLCQIGFFHFIKFGGKF